jgi:hypothetical protein
MRRKQLLLIDTSQDELFWGWDHAKLHLYNPQKAQSHLRGENR